MGDPAGQKRKQDAEIEAATTPSPSQAKVGEPAGQKRKQALTPSPSKAKVGEPAGEKRKAEEAVEDVEEKDGPSSPMEAKLDDNEEMDDEVITRATRVQGVPVLADKIDVFELQSEPGVAEEAKTFGLSVVDLREGWGINKKEDRNRLLEYVREKQPAFVIGRLRARCLANYKT